MTKQIWIDGHHSVQAFLSMIHKHPGTGSSVQAAKLLVYAIFDEGNFRLCRMSSFDTENREHALNILKALCYYAADFRTAAAKAHLRQFTKLRQALAKDA